MNIQTLSIVVPTNGCVNNCSFCCSKTHSNDYSNVFSNTTDAEQYRNDIKRRLDFAKLHNVDTIILTGTGEALQNKRFLEEFDSILSEMNNPFPRIEIQTTGVMLTDTNLKFLRKIGVSTISLSISNIFDNNSNSDIIGISSHLMFDMVDLCKKIKTSGFNLRLSLNMTSIYDDYIPQDFFDTFKELGANQVTFREMYSSNNNTPEDKWVEANMIASGVIKNIMDYISEEGRLLYTLPFGGNVYSLGGISTVIDDDCMGGSVKDNNTLKYLILREDGRLYCQWDDNGSLIF